MSCKLCSKLNIKVLSSDNYEETKNECLKGKSLDAIFSKAWKTLDSNKNLTPALEKANKSAEDADRYRIKGNVFYKKKQFEKALGLYNLSIMAAPHPVLKDDPVNSKKSNVGNCFEFRRLPLSRYGGTTEEGTSEALAKGFANRSALLFELGLHEKCIKDINYALDYGYPEELHAKLKDRKKKCKDALKKSRNGKDKYANSAIQFSEFDPLTWRVKLCSSTDRHPDISDEQKFKDQIAFEERKAPKLAKPNPNVPALSSAVKIAHIPSKGRGLVAVRNIKPGEVIAVEKAFCIELHPGKHYTNCSYCFSLCLTPLPCPACIKVVYCNEYCRANALSEEHWLECELFPTVISAGAQGVGLAYKMLKTCTGDQLLEMWQDLEEETYPEKPEDVELSEDGFFSSTSYRAIYHLCDNKKETDFDSMINQCYRAFAITKLLEQSERFFVNHKGVRFWPARERVCKTGAVILAHCLKLTSNSYTMRDVKVDAGKGIFPILNLINHSCNPSVLCHNRGRELIFRAGCPIVAGEELTITYCETYDVQSLAERQKYLKNEFFFTCSCEACVGNWPVGDGTALPLGKCFVCKKKVSPGATVCKGCFLSDEVRKVNNVFTKMQEVKDKLIALTPITTEDFQFLCKANTVIHKQFEPSSPVRSWVKHLMHRCFQVGH